MNPSMLSAIVLSWLTAVLTTSTSMDSVAMEITSRLMVCIWEGVEPEPCGGELNAGACVVAAEPRLAVAIPVRVFSIPEDRSGGPSYSPPPHEARKRPVEISDVAKNNLRILLPFPYCYLQAGTSGVHGWILNLFT